LSSQGSLRSLVVEETCCGHITWIDTCESVVLESDGCTGHGYGGRVRTVRIAGVLGFLHAQQGDASAPFSVRARLSVSYMSYLLLDVGTAMETHTQYIRYLLPSQGTYMCTDTTYRGAIHYYTILTLSGFP
jgi:hypothetical protein